MPTTRPLANRVAVVTGASRRAGIGAAICRALAAGGADVWFTHFNAYDRDFPWGADDDGPAALKAELEALGVRAGEQEIDLSAPDAATVVLDAATAALGAPAILINNAAYSTRDGYARLDAATLDAHYAVYLRTAALLSAEFARRFTGANGRIIAMTSGQGLGPMTEELAYAATKAAMEAITVTLAAEVGHLGITVNAVNPGPTDTGWMDDATRATLLPRMPFGRFGTPEDAARLVAFLASDDGAWITGQVIHSEGGFRRSG